MSEENKEPSAMRTVLVEAEEFELLREIRSERNGRLHVRVFAVHHAVVGYMLLIRVKLDGDGEATGSEIASSRDFLSGIVDWIEENGRESSRKSRSGTCRMARPVNPDWDA